MNCVSLQSDGRLQTEGHTAVQEALACLGHQVQLSDECSLRSVFQLLEVYPVLTRLGEFYPTLMEQYSQCPRSGCLWNDFNYLELAKTVEISKAVSFKDIGDARAHNLSIN